MVVLHNLDDDVGDVVAERGSEGVGVVVTRGTSQHHWLVVTAHLTQSSPLS